MESDKRGGPVAHEGFEFERFALALLQAEAAQQDRVLLIGNELSRDVAFADAIAPTGIFELPGPCLVEISLRIPTDRFLNNLVRVRSALPDLASILLVTRENSVAVEKVGAAVREVMPQVQFKVVTEPGLRDLAQRHPEAALSFDRSYLNRAVDSLRTRSEPRKNEQHLAALRAAYNDDRLAMLIGAGVSRSVGLPDWQELLRRVSTALFDQHTGISLTQDERDEVYEFFQAEGPSSPIIMGRLLRNSLQDEFADQIRAALYADIPAGSTSPLLSEIVTLCMPRRDRVGLTAVVNYNFDDLLESELDRRGIAYRVVLSDRDEPLRSELPIYHVHGFLPRNGPITDVHRDALVFSEESYHLQFTDPYLWTNVEQLKLLRSQVCLFIGLSLTDPNQRRLLEITVGKKSTVRHYAILKDHWTGSAAQNLSANGQVLARVFRGLEESSLANLGISVIWVKSHTDIAPLLSSIRQ